MALKKRESKQEGAPEWMVTYSDMVTLLLCFFILLFSMAVIDKQKFDELSFSLRSTLMHKANGENFTSNKGKSVLTVNYVNPDDTGMLRVDNKKYQQVAQEIVVDAKEQIRQVKLEQARKEMVEKIKELGLEDLVNVIEKKDYILVRLNSQVLFDSGSADLKNEGKFVLSELGEKLKGLDNEIMVQGHTDNVPISTELFPTNWELSTKRATNVVLYLVKQVRIDPTKLTATGNGEYRPIADNDTPEGRQKNRRIELVIIK